MTPGVPHPRHMVPVQVITLHFSHGNEVTWWRVILHNFHFFTTYVLHFLCENIDDCTQGGHCDSSSGLLYFIGVKCRVEFFPQLKPAMSFISPVFRVHRESWSLDLQTHLVWSWRPWPGLLRLYRPGCKRGYSTVGQLSPLIRRWQSCTYNSSMLWGTDLLYSTIRTDWYILVEMCDLADWV